MAFKEVQNLDAENTISLGGFNKKTRKENPTTAEGYFLGSKTVASPKSKTGQAFLHILKTPSGNLGVWGKTDLDRKLATVTPGNLVRITQNGMVPLPGGNEMYKFKVEVDTANCIEVSAAPSTVQSSAQANKEFGHDNYTDEAYVEEDISADESALDEIVPARPTRAVKAAAAPTTAAQNRVKELLNKNRSRSA